MQTLTDIKAILASRGLHPRHRFGQNFLIDAGKLGQILAAAELQPDDVVLEVGPGTGVLTEELLATGANVIGVEIDRDLSAILRQRLENQDEHFTLIEGDVLDGKHALNPQVAATIGGPGATGRMSDHSVGGTADQCSSITPLAPQEPRRTFKLIANLPYNVASPLIVNLAIDYPNMVLAIVMVQREVADRLTAGPGGKDYGPLGIIVQALCHVERITVLAPGCFWPQPKVDSAVLRLRRREKPLTDDPRALSALLQKLFGQRRKQIGSVLGRSTILPPGIDPNSRPEQLSIEQLVALAGTSR